MDHKTEYIEREAVKRLIESHLTKVCMDAGNPESPISTGYMLAKDHAIELVDIIPAADVVEVVRCSECKHSYFVKSCSKYECRKGCGTLKYSNDFCSYGERKEQT